ncbi:MAG: EcsC family protein [Pirellulales bacterium]
MDQSNTAPGATGRSLSDYESLQVQQIAAWKNTAPSRLSEFVDLATAPLTWVVGHFIPKKVVTKLVTSMESVAEKADSQAEVMQTAGVSDILELKNADLQTCDRLALQFSARAERFAVIESTAAGLGGPLFHIPQQLIAALRSIMRIGHCYGYPLTRPVDRLVVIDILDIAMVQQPPERQAVLRELFQAAASRESSLEGESDLIARTSRNMIAEEALDLVPVVGPAVSFLFDSTFMHTIDETARRVLQERWLRHNGCVTEIAPAATVSRKSSLQEFGLAFGQLLYTSGAIVGFTATFPGALVQKLVGRKRSPVSLGCRHGTDRAVGDAHRFLAGIKNAYDENVEGAAVEPAT